MSYQRTPQERICRSCGKQHVKVRISYVQTKYDGEQQQWNFDKVLPVPCDNYIPVDLGTTQQDMFGDDRGSSEDREVIDPLQEVDAEGFIGGSDVPANGRYE